MRNNSPALISGSVGLIWPTNSLPSMPHPLVDAQLFAKLLVSIRDLSLEFLIVIFLILDPVAKNA